jgi:hypothetical protein
MKNEFLAPHIYDIKMRCEKYSVRGIRCKNDAIAGRVFCSRHATMDPARNDLLSDDQERIRAACAYYDVDNVDVDDFCNSGLVERALDILRSNIAAFREPIISLLCNITSRATDRPANLLIENGGSEFQTLFVNGSDNDHVRATIYLMMNNIAACGAMQAQVVIDSGFAHRAAESLLHPVISSFMKECASLLINISKHASVATATELMTVLSQIPTVNLANIGLMKTLLWAIVHLYAKSQSLCGFPYATLLEMMTHPAIRRTVNTVVGEIVSGNNRNDIDLLINGGLPRVLGSLLSDEDPRVVNCILWITSNMAIDSPESVINTPELMRGVLHQMDTQFEALFVVANLLSSKLSRIHDCLAYNGAILQFIDHLEKRSPKDLNIILEGISNYLKYTLTPATYLFKSIITNVRALCTHGNPEIVTLATKVCKLVTETQHRFLTPRSAAELSLPGYKPSQSVLIAIDSLRDSIMGGISPTVEIKDLMFSPHDIAFLRACGYRILPNGTICVNHTIWFI